jgi:hypothetical protein
MTQGVTGEGLGAGADREWVLSTCLRSAPRGQGTSSRSSSARRVRSACSWIRAAASRKRPLEPPLSPMACSAPRTKLHSCRRWGSLLVGDVVTLFLAVPLTCTMAPKSRTPRAVDAAFRAWTRSGAPILRERIMSKFPPYRLPLSGEGSCWPKGGACFSTPCLS